MIHDVLLILKHQPSGFFLCSVHEISSNKYDSVFGNTWLQFIWFIFWFIHFWFNSFDSFIHLVHLTPASPVAVFGSCTFVIKWDFCWFVTWPLTIYSLLTITDCLRSKPFQKSHQSMTALTRVYFALPVSCVDVEWCFSEYGLLVSLLTPLRQNLSNDVWKHIVRFLK